MKITKRLLLGLIYVTMPAVSVLAQFTGKPQYIISTRRAGVPLGDIKIELFSIIAPKQVKNFDSLVKKKFFDSTAFHRVIPGFMIQGGDPNSRHGDRTTWGYGDPSQPTVPAEFSAVSHLRGILSAARDTNINSATSQFFICVGNPTYLDGQYSAYGRVVSGMNYVDTIVSAPRDANDNPYKKIDMFVTYTGSNDTIPIAPSLIAPINKFINTLSYINLKWSKVKDAVMYHVQVSNDSTFTTLYLNKDVSGTTCSIAHLGGSTKYYWRIYANNGGHLSLYPEVRYFTTVGTTSIAEKPENSLFLDQNIPNPSSGSTLIKFSIPNPTQVSIKLYDMLGKEIAVALNEHKNAGSYNLTFDSVKLSPGIYFYKLQAGDKSLVKKMIINN